MDNLRKHADVHVATDDGSFGYKGLVTELLDEKLESMETARPFIFYNCGPEPMIEAAMKIEMKHAPPERIFNAIHQLC